MPLWRASLSLVIGGLINLALGTVIFAIGTEFGSEPWWTSGTTLIIFGTVGIFSGLVLIIPAIRRDRK